MAVSPTTRALVELPLTGAPLALLERAAPAAPDVVRILTYHRLASLARFEAQVAHLARRYAPIRGADLLAALRGERTPPPRAVLVTFDDAYRQTVEEAWPILQRHRVPAVVFVPTAFPDRSEQVFWWDRLRAAFDAAPDGATVEAGGRRHVLTDARSRAAALRAARSDVKALPHAEVEHEVLGLWQRLGAPPVANDTASWEALTRAEAEGLELAPHGHLHHVLTGCGDDEVRAEVQRSLDELRQRARAPLPLFAYPAGRHDARVVELLRTGPCEAAVTTRRGLVDLRADDPFQLFRIGIGEEAGVNTLRARLLEAWLRHGRRRAPRGAAAGAAAPA